MLAYGVCADLRRVLTSVDGHILFENCRGAAILCAPWQTCIHTENACQRCSCVILCDRCHQVPFRKVAEAADVHGMRSTYQVTSKWQGQAMDPGVQFGDSTAMLAT